MALPGYPGGNDTFIPTLDLSGNLQVRFSRNVQSYGVNRYMKVVPVKKTRGSYLYFNPFDQIRLNINASTPSKSGVKWAPGTPRPRNTLGSIGFEVRTFTTQRYSESITLDSQGIDLANWDVQKANTEALAQKMMTLRAFNACSALTTSGNYPAAHVKASATAVGVGGTTASGTTSDPRIKKLLDAAGIQIQKATGGRIRQGELAVLINAETAIKWSQTREIREYVMQSAGSEKMLTMRGTPLNSRYGLPDYLYDYQVIVEDLFYDDANRPGTTTLYDAQAASPVFPASHALILTRSENLEGAEGAADYSTGAFFVYEDMTVESQEDKWNRLVDLSVVDNYDTKITAPVASYLVQDVFS
jgi:hypothetical protein